MTASTRPADGADGADGAVAGYRLTVPAGWFAVDLAPGRVEGRVAALVKRQFAGIDNAPRLRAQARRDLLAQARAAQAAGGLELFLSLQQVAGVPLAASLVVFLVPATAGGPGPAPVTPAELARSLAESPAGEQRQVTVADLPAGPAVRVLRRSTSATGSPSATLEMFVPVPDNGEWLLLSFATPLGPLAPALARLFDAIAATLRWDK